MIPTDHSLLSCRQFVTGADGSLSVSYSASGYGGMPYVSLEMGRPDVQLFALQTDVTNLKLCTAANAAQISAAQPNTTSAAEVVRRPMTGGVGVWATLAAVFWGMATLL